ncbi:MAG TPA: DUF4126 domain-containing protein [Planctomycetota bacterium]|nr:DUF4126 domain-containing protein [Planctomycetota bacterium]
MEYALALAVGVALAACCGLRAFLPLLATGILARTGHFHVHEHLEWLGSTPALLALSVAALVELAADKVPALDHALDVAQTPVRTVSGTLVAVAAFAPLPTWAAVLLGIAAGGATAFSTHAAKATVRAGSTVTTGALANPLLSVAEDVLCALGSFLAPVFAIVAVFMAVAAALTFFLLARALSRRLRGTKEAPPDAIAPTG